MDDALSSASEKAKANASSFVTGERERREQRRELAQLAMDLDRVRERDEESQREALEKGVDLNALLEKLRKEPTHNFDDDRLMKDARQIVEEEMEEEEEERGEEGVTVEEEEEGRGGGGDDNNNDDEERNEGRMGERTRYGEGNEEGEGEGEEDDIHTPPIPHSP